MAGSESPSLNCIGQRVDAEKNLMANERGLTGYALPLAALTDPGIGEAA
jgi:hypothetical protein